MGFASDLCKLEADLCKSKKMKLNQRTSCTLSLDGFTATV